MDSNEDIGARIGSAREKLVQIQQQLGQRDTANPPLEQAIAELSILLAELQETAQEARQLAGEQLADRPLQTGMDADRLALDLTGIGWWSWEIATDRLIWSDRLFELLGYVPGQVLPSVQNWRDRIHPDDRD